MLVYHDVTGHPTPFFRLRLLTQPRSFAAEVVKPQRYVQPPGTTVQAYFPRNVDWPQIIPDTTLPLFITEGEFKAACASKHKLPTIGLGGVYSWRSAKAGIEFLPELEDINWEGRHTYVIFDSDSQTNFQVMQALKHLAKTLTEHGAIPFIVKLPELKPGEKTGLDDFIEAKGVDALKHYLTTAEQFMMAEELWRMNDRVCFVHDPGFIIDLVTNQNMNAASFTREIFANEHFTEIEETAKGSKLVKKQTAVEWLKWQHRFEVKRLTYKPGQPRFVDDELNTWRPSGLTPTAGDATPWVTLLDHLFQAEVPAREWFERWCAHQFQHPGRKLLSAAVMWGVHQGTGKSLIGVTLKRLFGNHNASEVSQLDIEGSYNDWLVGKQLIIGDEITGTDRRQHADLLKGLITQTEIRVKAKYLREYTIPAVANFFFTSNHPDAFHLEDTDRRFFVHQIVVPALPTDFYTKTYVPWMRSDAGAAALLYHLLTLKLGDFDPDGPAFETTAKREMIEDNKSELAAWILRLKEDPRYVLKQSGLPEDLELINTTQLLAMFDPMQNKRITLNGMGRELKRSLVPRIKITPVNGTTFRFYAIQNQVRWLTRYNATDAAKHWLDRCGRHA